MKWNIAVLIDINNLDDVGQIWLILKVIDHTPGFDFFNNTFNECAPETIYQIIGMSRMAPVEEPPIKYDNKADYIGRYVEVKEVHQYFDMTSWSLVIYEEPFKSYTAKGNCFYVCGNGQWWGTPCISGMGFPRDRFGYPGQCKKGVVKI